MGFITGIVLIGIGAAVGWIFKGKVDEKDKQDPFKPQKEDY